MPTSYVEVQIRADPPDRLDKALARDVPEAAHLSRSRLVRLIESGAVSLNDRPVTETKARVTEGECYRITIEEASDVETLSEDIPLSVMYEDDDLIVIDKPAGLVVHPAPGSLTGTLVNALLHHFGGNLSGVGGERRPGIVHRIDKDTSGLLVVAKSDAAHHGLAAQFERHSVDRTYLAICHGVPDPGDPRLRGTRGVGLDGAEITITTRLARHKTDRQRQGVVWEGGRHAVTRLLTLEPFADQAALVECRLETGRTHQIRVHMAYVGHSLIGDPVYGGRRRVSAKVLGEEAARVAAGFSRQALHAATLGFTHPLSREEMLFESPMPQDMNFLLASLRGAV